MEGRRGCGKMRLCASYCVGKNSQGSDVFLRVGTRKPGEADALFARLSLTFTARIDFMGRYFEQ